MNDDATQRDPVGLFRAVHRGTEGAGAPLAWEWVSGDGDLDAARDTIAADGDRFMYVVEDARRVTEAWACIDGEAVMLPRFNWDGIAVEMAGWGLHRDAVSAWQDCPAAPWLLYAAPQIFDAPVVMRVLCAVIRAGLSVGREPAPEERRALDGVATLEAWSRGEVKRREVAAIEWEGRSVYRLGRTLQDAARFALLMMRKDARAACGAAASSVRELVLYKRMQQSRTLCDVVREMITPDMVFTAMVERLRLAAVMARTSAPDGSLEALAQTVREGLARRAGLP